MFFYCLHEHVSRGVASLTVLGKRSTFLIFPQISIDYSYFFSNFPNFRPHFSPPGGRLAIRRPDYTTVYQISMKRTIYRLLTCKWYVHSQVQCHPSSRIPYGYGLFSLRLIGSAMFGATFNLVTRVGMP